jgi:hypothetical protein
MGDGNIMEVGDLVQGALYACRVITSLQTLFPSKSIFFSPGVKISTYIQSRRDPLKAHFVLTPS